MARKHKGNIGPARAGKQNKSKGTKGAKIVRGWPPRSAGGQGKSTGPRDNNPPKKRGARGK